MKKIMFITMLFVSAMSWAMTFDEAADIMQ